VTQPNHRPNLPVEDGEDTSAPAEGRELATPDTPSTPAVPEPGGELEELDGIVDGEVVDEIEVPAPRRRYGRISRRLSYRRIAELEHLTSNLPHDDPRVRRACTSHECDISPRSLHQLYRRIGEAAQGSAPYARRGGRFARYGLAGGWRGTKRWWAWVSATDYAMRDGVSVDKIEAARKRRWIITGLYAAAMAGAWSWWWPSPIFVATLAFIIAGLVEKNIRGVTTEDEKGRKPAGKRPSSSVIRHAFSDAKLGKADVIRVVGPVVLDGEAWKAVVELPSAVTAKAAMARRYELASAFGVGYIQLDIQPVDGHEGRVTVRCANGNPFAATLKSPLLYRKTPLDIWSEGVPLGRDARQQMVAPKIVDSSFLLGGAPRTGKSIGVTNLACAAALDIRVRLHIIDGKGAADFDPFACICHTYFKRQPERLAAFLEGMVAKMEARYNRFSELKRRKLGADLLGEMPLEFIIVDELRWYTTIKEDKLGEKIAGLMADLASRGPAAGILLVLATQRTTVDVVPGTLRASVSMRWAMRCDGPTSSNAILGEGKAGDGYDASNIPKAPAYRGLGWLDADGATPVFMRSFYLDDEAGEVDQIIATAYRLREAAGTLPHADASPLGRLLLCLLDVFGETDRMWTETILDRLHEWDEWAALDSSQLSALLRPLGVGPDGLWLSDPHDEKEPGKKKSRNGYVRADVEDALDALKNGRTVVFQ
jgi:S-DNA-T family DNA segregation ATPase FtsK/SpoIIIE